MPKGKATPLTLAPGERGELERLVRRRKTAQDLALRAKVVLRCAEGATNQAVAREAGVCAHTVGKWRERFAKDRLEGLRDAPRSGAPRTVTDERIAELLGARHGLCARARQVGRTVNMVRRRCRGGVMVR